MARAMGVGGVGGGGGGGMRKLFEALYGSGASQDNLKNIIAQGTEGVTDPAELAFKTNLLNSQWDAAAGSPLKGNVPLSGFTPPEGFAVPEGMGNVSGLRTTMSNLGANIKANPGMSAGLGLAGAANVAGLFDNDKIGGQLLGGVGGYAIPKLMGSTWGPAGMALSTLGGGALGSLFDKLRAQKELEAQSQYKYGDQYDNY